MNLSRALKSAVLGSLILAGAASSAYAQGPGGPNGVDILIRAENRSTDDRPFCGVGGGTIGDKLCGCGGLLVQNEANQNTVPIWFNDFFPSVYGYQAALVNVELPRGCGNTKATFTPGVDKVTMQLKFR